MANRPFATTEYYGPRAKVSDGKSVRVTATGDVEANKLYYIDGFLGFAMRNAKATEKTILNIESAEFETDQIVKTDAMAVGSDVYWDVTQSKLTNVPTAIHAGKVTVAKDANSVIWFKLNSQVKGVGNYVVTGLLVGAPTNASSHADASNYDFNVDTSVGLVVVGTKFAEIAAETDFDVDHGTESPISATKPKIIYAVVASNDSGTVTLKSVAGAAAAADKAVPPTDAEITASLEHANWIRVANVTAIRTGATAVTVTIDNTVRPIVGL
jgi:predicted RecA/RadA family phage recombinase